MTPLGERNRLKKTARMIKRTKRIRKLYTQGYSCSDISEKMEISYTTIRLIVTAQLDLFELEKTHAKSMKKRRIL